MSILISNIILPFTADENEATQKAAKLLGMPRRLEQFAIRRKSVDARRKNEIKFVYSVKAELGDPVMEQALVHRLSNSNIAFHPARKPLFEKHVKSLPGALRPVVVGFGPAGMFASLLLARAGLCPIVAERGDPVESRVEKVEHFWKTGELDPFSNVQFGEGGAGTFSDGKLNTGINDEYCDAVLETFAQFGADGDILTNARPHIGTDVLRTVVKNIRMEIISLGGEILFGRTLTDLSICSDKLTAALFDDGTKIETDTLVLAIGHSARDTFEMLCRKGVALEQKPFSAGVRLEQLQSSLDRALYGTLAGHPKLPPAEYKLSHREGGRGVYSFCMCPGGVVVASSSEAGMVVTNGMSYKSRAGANANAAIVVSVGPGDFDGSHPLAGMEFQRKLESAAFRAGGGGYAAPGQTVDDFNTGRASKIFGAVRPTYQRGILFADLNGILPPFITGMLKTGFDRFDRAFSGFDSRAGLLTGVETRTSSPVRILRDNLRMAAGIAGLYPVGEGSGYAGGIVSAAVDGIKTAREIVQRIEAAEL